MSDITIRPYLEGDLNSIVSLWEICELSRPWNDPIKDIERKLTVQRDLFLILKKSGEIVGSVKMDMMDIEEISIISVFIQNIKVMVMGNYY